MTINAVSLGPLFGKTNVGGVFSLGQQRGNNVIFASVETAMFCLLLKNEAWFSKSQYCQQCKQYFKPNRAARHQTNVTQVLERGRAAWRGTFPFCSTSLVLPGREKWTTDGEKGQTLALGPRLFHTALCANPQSVAQSDRSGYGAQRHRNEVAHGGSGGLFRL